MARPIAASKIGIVVDRSAAMSLCSQISGTLRSAILEKRIEPGARLPSWRDLAVQLGVARGTVRAAYEALADESLVVSLGAAGTHVAESSQQSSPPPGVAIAPPLGRIMRGFSKPVLPFMSGVPARDAFPAKLWTRIHIRAVRDEAVGPTTYPDPRGSPELRTQIASYLAIARGIRCVPDQIIITNGFRDGLGLAIRTLNAEGRAVWTEDPSFPVTRWALELANMKLVPVPVDAFGLNVERGIALAPDAIMAVVTPGQQAPTGVTLSLQRRQALLHWAVREDAWIIEDDYLSELQLDGRAAPALAANDPDGRVIHVGSFSKTLKPSLGLGFVVAPLRLAERFGEVAACLSPAFNQTVHAALSTFIAEGHYLRHLRRMKRLYAARRDAFRNLMNGSVERQTMAGLAILLDLSPGVDDVEIAKCGLALGIAPTPLSPWYSVPERRRPGLMLSVTNLTDALIEPACATLTELLASAANP
jgi:GntR family transcriptional regulator/MocR family aminotransferase